MLCKASRLSSPPESDATWGKPPWKDIPSELLQNHMGKKPDHFPKTEVKIAYDDKAVWVMFRVEDQYVRAVTEAHQGNVWEDSCVEFFFTPHSDTALGYFNLEMNCGGVMLFHYHPGEGKDRVVIPESDCSKITCTHSLPRMVDPEIKKTVTWTVAYGVPIALLKHYCRVMSPAPRVVWRTNFYKCGDNTSHPHWLTWSPVNFPKPNFHLPQSFGILEFQ